MHDPGRALAADHAVVYRMRLVALDVADAAVLQMYLDAATAGAHVAGRVFDLVRDHRGCLDLLTRLPIVPPAFAPALVIHFGIPSAGYAFSASRWRQIHRPKSKLAQAKPRQQRVSGQLFVSPGETVARNHTMAAE